ncbi:hypothetical protein Tco_1299917, partial [Tanacetum coccineum]
ASIRSDRHLEDAECTDCLPTATIFEELARMGYEKPSQKLTFYKALFSPQWKFLIHTITQCLSAKSTAWNAFSSTMASLIICLATNQKFNLSKYIFNAMVKHLDGGQKQKSKRRQRKEVEVAHDETEHEESIPNPSNDPLHSGEDIMQLNDLMVLYTKLQTQILDLEKAKDAQAKEIADLKKRVQRRVESSEDQESLGDHEDASKYGRSIEYINADAEVTLINETQERQDDDLMFDTGVLDDDEVFVDVATIEKEEQSTKTSEAVTTAGVEDSVAPTIPTTVEETLAQTLMEIKAAKPKAKEIVFHY